MSACCACQHSSESRQCVGAWVGTGVGGLWHASYDSDATPRSTGARVAVPAVQCQRKAGEYAIWKCGPHLPARPGQTTAVPCPPKDPTCGLIPEGKPGAMHCNAQVVRAEYLDATENIGGGGVGVSWCTLDGCCYFLVRCGWLLVFCGAL